MRIGRRVSHIMQGLILAAGVIAASAGGCADDVPATRESVAIAKQGAEAPGGTAEQDAVDLVEEGREIFRRDTFGSEEFWGDQLRLHDAIKGAELGGVGPGLSPTAALGLGLKVDVEALPADVLELIASGQVDLNDPAVTVELLRLDAVLGVRGFFCPGGELHSVGIQCALCHSTVDDSFAPGVGRRLDGWPNRRLNIGEIIALAPNLRPLADELHIDDLDLVRTVLRSWGPGKFDAELLLDGKAFQPDGRSAATVLPAAFGLAGVNLHTYTGWGSVPYWNAFVANVPMHGKGRFFDPRLNDPVKFPLAVANGFFNIEETPDLITSKLPALHLYQLALLAPEPPAGSFDPDAAQRGEQLFSGKAGCARCHVPPLYTEPGWNMHTGAEICIDEFQAMRSPDERYRTTPLKGLFTRQEGGFYHDGRFPTLGDVIAHYDACFSLGLTSAEKQDLAQFLKSL